MKRNLILLVMLLQAATAVAQIEVGGWYQHFSSFRIPQSRFSIYLDANFHISGRYPSNEFYVIRPGVNFQINEKMTVSAGYAYADNTARGFKAEHRAWEQFGIVHRAGRFINLEHRLRLEQRFQEAQFWPHPVDMEPQKKVGHRLRYLIRECCRLISGKILRKAYI